MRVVSHILCALLALSVFGEAGAEPSAPSVHLIYQPGPHRMTCPAEEELRAGVAGRLGRQPFSSRASRTVRALVETRGTGLGGIITVVEDDGTVAGTRELESESADCRELGKAMELAIAIAIDPVAAMGKAPEQPPPPPARQQPVNIGAPSAPPKRARGIVTKFGLNLGAGSTPGVAPGLHLAVGMRRRQWSLLVEGRVDWPANHDVGDASIRGTQVLASAMVCGHWGRVIGCGIASGGVLKASGRGFPMNLETTTPVVAGGGRFGFRHALADIAELEWFADVRAPLTKTELTVDGVQAWSSAPIMGALGVAAVWGGRPR